MKPPDAGMADWAYWFWCIFVFLCFPELSIFAFSVGVQVIRAFRYSLPIMSVAIIIANSLCLIMLAPKCSEGVFGLLAVTCCREAFMSRQIEGLLGRFVGANS